MVIRKADKNDIDGVNNLLRQVLEVHHTGRPDLFKTGVKKYCDDELMIIFGDSSRPVFVYEDEGMIKGYAFCIVEEHHNENILTDIKTLYIDDLCVDENFRGQHIGKSIYEYVLKYAKEIGCYNVTLNVWSCNESAEKFYRSLGLVPYKTGMEKIL